MVLLRKIIGNVGVRKPSKASIGSLAVFFLLSIGFPAAGFSQTCTPMDASGINGGQIGPTTLADPITGLLFESQATAVTLPTNNNRLVGSSNGDIGEFNNGESITFTNTVIGSSIPFETTITLRVEQGSVAGFLDPEWLQITSTGPISVSDPLNQLDVNILGPNSLEISPKGPVQGNPSASWSLTTTASTLTIRQDRGGDPWGSINVLVGCTEIQADLVTVKTLASSDTTPSVGDLVTYEITVTNNGPGKATNVALTDLLPSGLVATPNNGLVSQGSYNSGLWEVGFLDVGDAAFLTLEGIVIAGEEGNTIINTATAAAGDQQDPTIVADDLSESVTVEILAEADLSVSKSNGTAQVSVGDITTYTITVTHESGDTVSGAIVTDSPGARLTCHSNDPVIIAGAGVPSGSFTIEDLTGTGIALGTLSAGQSTTLTYSCQIN